MVKINPFWIRIFLILVLPIILSTVVLFNPTETIPLLNDKNKDGNTILKVSEDMINPPSFKNTIRDIFQVPFDLKWYNICFENRDTKLIYESGEVDTNVTVTVNFNNDTIITIPYGETVCKLYKINKDFTSETTFQFKTDFDFETMALYGGIYPYAKPEIWGIVTKTFLFVITWFGLALIFAEIYKLLMFGMKK